MSMRRLPDRTAGPRLSIRRWEADDVDPMADAIAASVEHLRPWMPWVAEEPLAREARLELIERWRREWDAGGDLVVALFADAIPVGGSGLHRRIGPGALEIGYWVHVDHVGQGYASEAAAALTSLAFTVPGIDRVEIHHDRANTASGAVPRRLGFAWVGESIDEVTAPGECGVEVRWSMARDDWAGHPSPAPS